MIERRGGAGLAQQALASFGGGSSSRQYFHCYFAMQFQIGGAVNDAHAAAADFTIKPVALAEYRSGNDRAVDDFVATKDASVLRIVTHFVIERLFRPGITSSSARGVRQIFFLENRSVVGDVSGENVRERAYRNFIAAGNTAARPGLVRQISEEAERSLAHGAKVVDVTGPGKLIGIGGRSGYILIVAWQLIGKTARKPEGAKEKNALCVVDVVEQLSH